MVNENIPKTETVFELKENYYEIRTSQLSPTARSKIIKMSGGNYRSPLIDKDISKVKVYGPNPEKNNRSIKKERSDQHLIRTLNNHVYTAGEYELWSEEPLAYDFDGGSAFTAGSGGVEVKAAGFGFSVGKKMGISTPLGGVSVDADDCVVQ